MASHALLPVARVAAALAAHPQVRLAYLAGELADLAGLRNVLVHAYLRVRVDLLREHAREAPARLRRFAAAVAALLAASAS